MTKPKAPRGTNTSDRVYRKMRARYRAKCEAVQAPCWICGQPISYRADSPDPWELDHYHPRSRRPDLAIEPANARPSHSSCNRSRGNADVRPTLGQPSEDW
ncbi:HNH endonuclease [Gordonia sp. HS-NH1]|uniref:HNH endonuclease n=1 Tax=Gordonia sp. HS-NH1 TaxID=1435068 RepID=UPI000B1D2561|nr:HNH endonuclease [Gordonia sp. HS-NH1]